jgi:hypothetical protein
MRKRKQPGLRKIVLDPQQARPLLDEAGVRIPGGDPEIVHGWVDAAGRPRRILARYAGGWRAEIRMYLDGTFSLSQSIKIKSAPIAGAEPS